MSSELDLTEHFTHVIRALRKGRLIFFMGAGANLCDREDGWNWSKDQRQHLPSGFELSSHLSETFSVEPSADLARVAQSVVVQNDTATLYDELRDLFDGVYPPTRLHGFLASLPRILRTAGYPRTSDANLRRLLFVTTNYDDLLERAFDDIGETFHVLVYEADGLERGTFFYVANTLRFDVANDPRTLSELLGDDRPLIVKFHGSRDRADSAHDSFVITEDHYIDYLVQSMRRSPIPATLTAQIRESHVLFLGHSLRDWNLRVILNRIWEDRKLDRRSWAIQLHTDRLDQAMWQRRGVMILEVKLREYVRRFDGVIRTLL